MVICSDTKYAPKTIVRDRQFRDRAGNVIKGQPIYIIAEVDHQAWVDYMIAEGCNPAPEEIARAKQYKYFYHVHTD